MMDLALRNYIRAFRWQNIKEKYHNGGWFFMLYLLIFFPLLNNYNEEKVIIFEFDVFFMIPFVYIMFTSVLYPMTLPKLMYLSPMSKEMRKDYILKACFIRTAVPIFLTLLLLIFPLRSGLMDWLSALGIFLNLSIYSVFLGSGTNMNGYGNIDKNGGRSIPMDSLQSIKEGVVFFSCLLINIGYVPCSAPTANLVLKLLLLGTTLLIPLPVTLSYLKSWPGSVENALSYETCMPKPTKAK